MKSTLLFILMLVAINVFSQDDKTAIRKVLKDQNNAWNEGNIVRFMEGYWNSDSLMFVGQSGLTYGYKKTLANYQKSYPDTATMGKLKFDILHINKLAADYYNVVGHWHLTRTAGDVQGYFTLLFRKIKGVWVIVQDHSS